MRRLTILLVALLGLLLTACAPASTPAPASTSTAAPATNTPQAKATEPATVVSQPEATKPVATPDIDKIIKAQPDDWKRGPDNAKVTIIEWGDFQ
ncbi:MAG TPA: hypothetical protein VMP08_07390 [Anaerolineae bacterium]|nr:hypothetical protein [Anaerolineae bacterium]